MSTRTCKVGIHGRNHEDWGDLDFQVLRDARVEVVKAMSQTRPQYFERAKRENDRIEIITRLHGDGFGAGSHPSPEAFAGQMIPIMANLRDFCVKFEVHNEPNHVARYEGWGATDEDARDFNNWFLQVYGRLKDAHPWASIGFPGLALPHFGHRDWEWLNICRPAIQQADWLGVHCYWQTPPGQAPQLMHEALGMNFKHYHDVYPNKTLEILECGNSNIQNNYPISDEDVASEYVQWLQEVFKYPYVNSASFFILSSQDTQWGFFSWRTEDGALKPLIFRVKDMFRPELRPVHTPPPPPPLKPPVVTPAGLTNQLVINAFNRASRQLGLGDWGLLDPAGLSLGQLVKNRAGAYTGPLLADMPKLTDDQRRLVRAQLPDGISFAPTTCEGFLVQDEALLLVSLAYPRAAQIRKTQGAIAGRVARAWNRCGSLLSQIADRLGVDPEIAVAALAASCDLRGPGADGRMRLRFDVALFHERWGRGSAARFADHFRCDPARPWQGQQWRPAADASWQDIHASHAGEWAAFELARSLDKPAACEATALGFPRLLGASYALVGYASAAQMFDAFASSERFQVLAFFDLLAGQGASSREAEALRRRDTDAFAALHVGSGDVARYAITLREAVAAFQRFNPLR